MNKVHESNPCELSKNKIYILLAGLLLITAGAAGIGILLISFINYLFENMSSSGGGIGSINCFPPHIPLFDSLQYIAFEHPISTVIASASSLWFGLKKAQLR